MLLEKSDFKIETFFSLIENNTKKFLINKELTINPTLSDAISDLLKSNGIVKSETQHFYAGIYGEATSKYQKYLHSRNIHTARQEHNMLCSCLAVSKNYWNKNISGT